MRERSPATIVGGRFALSRAYWRLPVRRVVVLGLPYMLTLWLNPAVVLAALLWCRVPMIAALCAAGVWQVAWLALVYGAGRFSVSN